MCKRFCWAWLVLALPAMAVERKFDFSGLREQQTPPGFHSTVTGKGKPGDWKIVLDEVPSPLPLLTPEAHVVNKRPVLAQLAQDPTDDHYPLLVFDEETYRDFTLTTRFKLVGGVAEQMAGVAFRIQDEKNYYYVRASALGNTFYFFKFVNGELIGPIGAKVPISRGVWHELSVECRGSQITCSLDGQALIPQMQQDAFTEAKSGSGPNPIRSATSPTPKSSIRRWKSRRRNWCARWPKNIRGCWGQSLYSRPECRPHHAADCQQ